MKKISILGSTGSIGVQALEVISAMTDKPEIVALAAGNNVELLKNQIEKFHPKQVCITSCEHARTLKNLYPKLDILCGESGLEEIASNKDLDLILIAVSGKIGLKPTIKAIQNSINIALANKETLVMAGDIVTSLAKKNNVKIIPVDSEHSAIFQCLRENDEIHKLIITASGGPFLNSTQDEMKNATAENALKHPKWNMGRKITIDSATLMNKGLEVIEAHHLFGISYDDIKVVIHPQSIVHSAVEFKDGSVLAQMGLPSMHLPIQYALTYPKRVKGIKTDSFDLIEISQLNFANPDLEKFKALKLAIEAGKKGDTYPIVLNAANEEAVFAFLNNQIKLIDIINIVEDALSNHSSIKNPSLEQIFEIDRAVRTQTKSKISSHL